jgi:Xaa-Pro aminopeptidase
MSFLPQLTISLINVFDIIALLWRYKNMYEIEILYKAVNITMITYETTAHVIK